MIKEFTINRELLKSHTPLISLTLIAIVAFVFFASLPSAKATEETEPLSDHLNINILSSAIQNLNEGKKDFCFLPCDFSKNEKTFLEKLEVKLPNNALIGKDFSFQGSISFSYNDKQLSHSVFSKVKANLDCFFTEYTNAHEVGSEYNIDGPRLLSRIILEFSEKLLDQVNIQQSDADKIDFLFISIKAFKKNDAFLNFLRWHYDGNIRTGAADLNFAGAFIGSPTVFSEINDESRLAISKRIDVHNSDNDSDKYSLSSLTEQLTKARNKFQDGTREYINIDYEIKKINLLNYHNDDRKTEILKRLYNRMDLHYFIEENQLISDVVKPKQNEIAIFTMNGEKPALHSEPNIEIPRIFFGLRVYQSMRSVTVPMTMTIGDLSDPRTY